MNKLGSDATGQPILKKTIGNSAVLKTPETTYPPTPTVETTIRSRYATIEKTASLVVDGNATTWNPGTQEAPVETQLEQVIEYKLTIENFGEITSGKISVTDAVPTGTTYVRGSASSGGVYDGDKDTVTWTLDNVETGKPVDVTFRVTAPKDAKLGANGTYIFKNRATLTDVEKTEKTYTSDWVDENGKTHVSSEMVFTQTETTKNSNQTFHVVREPSAGFDKMSNPEGNVREGDVITYTVSVKVENTGLKNWKITDKLPEGVAYVKGSLKEANGKLALGDANYLAQAHQIMIEGEEPLPVGEYKITYQALVKKLAIGETELAINNEATLTGDSIPDTTVTTENRAVSRWAEIHKTASLVENGNTTEWANGTQNAPVLTKLNQVVEYRLTVTNHASGGLLSGDIIVADKVPEGMRLVADSITNGGMLGTDGKTITWTLNGMKDGETKELTFRATAPAAITEAPYTLVMENVATMKDTEVEGREYAQTVTTIGTDGEETTVTEDDSIYTEQETTKESEHTWHEARDGKLVAVKASSRMNDNDPATVGRPVKVGDGITYTIVIRNDGAASCYNVKVRDYIPIGTKYVAVSATIDGAGYQDDRLYDATKNCVTWNIAELKVGQRAVLQFRVTVETVVDANGNPLSIRNAALFDKNIPPEDPGDPKTPTNEVTNPTLVYVKEAIPNVETVREGQVITYRIRVTASDNFANAMTMTDTLPLGMSLVSGSVKFKAADGSVKQEADSTYDRATRTITWTKQTLKKGESVFELKAVADKLTGETLKLAIKNTAIIKDDQNRRWPEETVTQTILKRYADIEKTAALVVKDDFGSEKLDGRKPGTAQAPVETLGNQTVEYILIVKNHGELPSKEIVVTDVVPEGMTYVSGSMTGVGGKVTSAVYDTATRTLRWTIDKMDAESTLELKFRATAPDRAILMVNKAILTDRELTEITYTENVTTVDGATHTTTETVYKEDETTKPSNETFHRVTPAKLEAIKSSSPASGSKVYKGDIITYTVKVKNIGGTAAKNVVIRDAIPQYTTYVKNSAYCTGNGAMVSYRKIGTTNYVVAVVPHLANGETATLTFRVRVNGMRQVGTRTIRNVAQTLIADPEKPLEEEITNGDFDDTKLVITLIDHYRLGAEFGIVAALALMLIAFGGVIGCGAMVSLAGSAVIVWKVLIPLLLKGVNPIAATCVAVVVLTAIIDLLVAGFTKRCLVAILGSLAGTLVTLVAAGGLTLLLKLDGGDLPYVVPLLAQSSMGIDTRSLYIGMIFLANSGALMDLSMDISVSMEELVRHKPDINRRALTKSGRTVGRSVLGTMTTTLMLAYSGNYLSMLMYFVGQGTPVTDILNLKYVASQLLNTLVGSFGLVAAAPLTAWIACRFYLRKGDPQ